MICNYLNCLTVTFSLHYIWNTCFHKGACCTFLFRLRALQHNECSSHQLINSQWPVMSIVFMVGLVKVLTDTHTCVLHSFPALFISYFWLLVFSYSLFSFFLCLFSSISLFTPMPHWNLSLWQQREPAASTYLHGCWYTSLLQYAPYIHTHTPLTLSVIGLFTPGDCFFSLKTF